MSKQLHDQIINIQADIVERDHPNQTYADLDNVYKTGHRDGLHAAAELTLQHSEWVSVSERLPEIGATCVTWRDNYPWIDDYVELRESPVDFSSKTICTGTWFADDDLNEVTHWMLITPPSTNTEES